MKLRTISMIVAASAIVATVLPRSFATPPAQNPTNFVNSMSAMLTAEGMSAAAATNLAKAVSTSPAANAIYASQRDFTLNATEILSVTGIPFAVTGILYPPGSTVANITGITNAAGGWTAIGYAGNGLWQIQPSGTTFILTGRVDNIQGLLP